MVFLAILHDNKVTNKETQATRISSFAAAVAAEL